MKKRFSRKQLEEKAAHRGAYDLSGKWWNEQDVQVFTGGMIELCFGKKREDIIIVEK